MNETMLKDVARRTSGALYVGVVGSVRSGKSTFIRHFVEKKILPYLVEKEDYSKIQDELPQSAEGKNIMTVEPKFIPTNKTMIKIGEDIQLEVKFVDCVGYVIPNAKGYLNEDGSKRYVQTPWFSDAIPFEEAAQIGTKKVMESHSELGLVITSDGSFGEFTREDYAEVEDKIIPEMASTGKPFVVIVNTVDPTSSEVQALVEQLQAKYQVSVLAENAKELTEEDADEVLKTVLSEFDISELNLSIPEWVKCLDDEESYKKRLNEVIQNATKDYRKMKDVFDLQDTFKESGLFDEVEIVDIDSGSGIVNMNLGVPTSTYQDIVRELLGTGYEDRVEFLKLIQKYHFMDQSFGKYLDVLPKLTEQGFSVAYPNVKEIELCAPVLFKEGSRYGIKIKASAPMVELVQVKVEASFDPIIGSMAQAEALLKHMKNDFDENPEKLWNSEIFGQKLGEVIYAGLEGKVRMIPDSVQLKYHDAMEKILNSGQGGILAIIL
jgi:stage IV sporulation protein A